MRDTTAMKIHPKPLHKEFPERTYKQKLQGFCRMLAKDLDKIDIETSWSEEYFTPLDAEVEIQNRNRRVKKVTDLLTAIKADHHSKTFLILGDPGSGKSVALRKLCRDLLKEVDKTGKVPIYINLREWIFQATSIERYHSQEVKPLIPPVLHQKITEFLSRLPNIHGADGQRALLYQAGVDSELENHIPFGKPVAQFIPLLVSILFDYGKLRDGRNALQSVLESAKQLVGQDRNEYCDTLIKDLQPFLHWIGENNSSQFSSIFSIEQLHNFVLNNLKERGDVFTNEFLDLYFNKMMEYGRFFIILDSFDEIPSVLDTDTSSDLVNKLSEVIYNFLSGSHESRGILASRFFRKPTQCFQAETIVEIRPFTESKIRETFEKSLMANSERLTKFLFTERQEFIPIARNPFTAALIVSYAKEHNNTLPQTQAELYSDYIHRRLTMCQEKARKKNLTKEKIIQCAENIAYVMFMNDDFGLDAPLTILKEQIQQSPVEDVIDVLIYGRLGRLGGNEECRFSFSHRRFQEFLVTKKILENPQKTSIESIPADSRWRDALVLYCEVAENEEAKRIAEFCWQEIRKISDEGLSFNDQRYLRAIHSLRFLKDAFRARNNCLTSFREELANFIGKQLESNDLLSAKLAVEAVGLLEDTRIDSLIIKALNIF